MGLFSYEAYLSFIIQTLTLPDRHIPPFVLYFATKELSVCQTSTLFSLRKSTACRKEW